MAHPHKDTPETFWERMRLIHGPDVHGPEEDAPEPLFRSPELLDVLRPSRKERAALKEVSENPPDIAGAVRQVTSGQEEDTTCPTE